MPVIFNRILPFGRNFFAINLFGIIFAKGYCNAFVLNHEKIHTAQMKELLFIPFYIWYVLEWIVRIIQYRDRMKAYRNISFEREAYSNDRDLSYLKSRKMYSFLSYLKLKNY